MGKIFFSPSRMGFYPESDKEIYEKAGSWPEDGVPINEKLWRELLDGETKGKVISADSAGNPFLSDPPEPSKEIFIAEADRDKAMLMVEATTAIATLTDAIELEMATEQERSQLVSWKKYRVLLSRIDTSQAPDIKWPERP